MTPKRTFLVGFTAAVFLVPRMAAAGDEADTSPPRSPPAAADEGDTSPARSPMVAAPVAPPAAQNPPAPPAQGAAPAVVAGPNRMARLQRLNQHRSRLLAGRRTLVEKDAELKQRQNDTQYQYGRSLKTADEVRDAIDDLEVLLSQTPISRSNPASSVAARNAIRAQQRNLLARLEQLEADAERAQLLGQAMVGESQSLTDSAGDVVREAETLRSDWVRELEPFAPLTAAEHQEAATWFEGLIDDNRQDAGAWLGRGLAHWHLGQLAKSLEDLNHAVECNGGLLGPSYAVRANIHALLGQHRESDADFAAAAKANCDLGQLAMLRGIAQASTKKLAGAELEIERAVRNGHAGAAGYRLLALVHLVAHPVHAARALEAAERACELTDDADWSSCDLRAAALAYRDDFAAAIQWERKAVDLAPASYQPLCEERLRQYQAGKPIAYDWNDWFRAR